MDEPKRKSLLDSVKKNLSYADKLAFVTRYIFIGEYHGSSSDLQKKLREDVKELKREYGEKAVTGLLLVYPKNFLQLCEGTIEVIIRLFKVFFSKRYEKLIGRMISLPANHNIYKLYFDDWYILNIVNPPMLLQKITTVESDEIQRHVKNCLLKVYSLSEYIYDLANKSNEKIGDIVMNTSIFKPHHLPASTKFEYLLSVQTPVLHDLRAFMSRFEKVPSITLYNDRIWPPAYGMIPQTIGSKWK